MNVAYIFTMFPCRSETFALGEIEQLCKLQIKVTVFAAANPKQSLLPEWKEPAVYRPRFFSTCSFLSIGYLFVNYPFGIVKLIGLILKLILLNPREARLIAANIHTVAFFAKILDKKLINHIHAYFLNWPSCIAKALAIATGRTFSIAAHARDLFVEHGAIKLKASYACFIVTCTQYGLDYLKSKLPTSFHDKLQLSYHGVSTDPCAVSRDVRNTNEGNKYVLIAVGRLVPKKGFDCLIKAFSLVCKSFRDCILFVAGDGSEYGKLRTLTDRMNLKGRVKFLGWLKHSSTIQYISTSNILVMPSVIASDGDRDGIPNVILEAFAKYTPVIASNLHGIAEAVKHKETGLLVEPGNVDQLAIAITTLLQDETLRKQLSKRAYEIVESKFDPEKNSKQLAKLFTEVNK